MNNLLLFTDGSVNTKLKIGYGAYVTISDSDLSVDFMRTQVKLKRFEQTSSTKLELQTLLWALSEIKFADRKVIIYTDSQNIICLPSRRERLVKNEYYTNKNILINNHELYKEFYNVTDKIDCEIVKVHGHMPAKQKQFINKVFSIVDKASRNALRQEFK